MRKVIYDVAMTLDGFIGHEDGSIGKFVAEGAHVDAYLERLQHYDTVVMGRKTYEFGYQYGLEPGARAYPHMEHHIFSSSLSFAKSQVNVVKDEPHATVRQLKEEDGGPIYLCGGGALAGHLLKHKLIDELIIKLNPVCSARAFRFSVNMKRPPNLHCLAPSVTTTASRCFRTSSITTNALFRLPAIFTLKHGVNLLWCR